MRLIFRVRPNSFYIGRGAFYTPFYMPPAHSLRPAPAHRRSDSARNHFARSSHSVAGRRLCRIECPRLCGCLEPETVRAAVRPWLPVAVRSVSAALRRTRSLGSFLTFESSKGITSGQLGIGVSLQSSQASECIANQRTRGTGSSASMSRTGWQRSSASQSMACAHSALILGFRCSAPRSSTFTTSGWSPLATRASRSGNWTAFLSGPSGGAKMNGNGAPSSLAARTTAACKSWMYLRLGICRGPRGRERWPICAGADWSWMRLTFAERMASTFALSFVQLGNPYSRAMTLSASASWIRALHPESWLCRRSIAAGSWLRAALSKSFARFRNCSRLGRGGSSFGAMQPPYIVPVVRTHRRREEDAGANVISRWWAQPFPRTGRDLIA
jgi:hypothetical protein